MDLRLTMTAPEGRWAHLGVNELILLLIFLAELLKVLLNGRLLLRRQQRVGARPPAELQKPFLLLPAGDQYSWGHQMQWF